MTDETRDPGNNASPESRYSNYVEIGFNAFEFLVAFGQVYSESEQPQTHTRIVMSPHYAKSLLETLQKSLSQYDDNYGALVNTETTSGPIPLGSSAAAAQPAKLAAAAGVVRNVAPVVARAAATATPGVNDAVQAMLGALKTYLPTAAGGLPNPSVSVASVTERSLGLNRRRGEEARAGLQVVELKGVRLEAVVRFELWAAQPGAVEQALQDLVGNVLADRDKLWTLGFLRLSLIGISASENVPALTAWRQSADLNVLFEFQFEDSDDSGGLIASIPIHINSTYDETTTVTDEMVRWDNQAAHVLVVRGPVTIGELSALVFIAGAAPTGSVTLTRTFDGASGPAVSFPMLAAFLAGISGANAQRNAQLVFASWSNFMAIFSPGGTPVTLGIDNYSPFEAALDPAISLGGVEDIFEIAYQKPALEVNAVVYLRGK